MNIFTESNTSPVFISFVLVAAVLVFLQWLREWWQPILVLVIGGGIGWVLGNQFGSPGWGAALGAVVLFISLLVIGNQNMTGNRQEGIVETATQIPTPGSGPSAIQAHASIHENNGSIIGAVFVMFIVSLLLFWLPVIGPLIAGLFGGRKAGGVISAIVAVFLPGLVFGAILFTMATAISNLPLIGAFAGMGAFALASAHIGPLFFGAVLGGLFSKS